MKNRLISRRSVLAGTAAAGALSLTGFPGNKIGIGRSLALLPRHCHVQLGQYRACEKLCQSPCALGGDTVRGDHLLGEGEEIHFGILPKGR